jgi:hypothetical protein
MGTLWMNHVADSNSLLIREYRTLSHYETLDQPERKFHSCRKRIEHKLAS